MTDPIRRMAAVIAAENAALEAGDAAAVARLLPEKRAAAEALHAAPPAAPDRAELAALHGLAERNAALLAHALDVQARVLELVARAARDGTPAAFYGGTGAARPAAAALAMSVRA